jgi:CheY-like chemotaxis protein
LKIAEKEIPVKETSQEASENQHARILLADDEPMIREVIKMMLAQHGWQVETAESGGEAVAKWEKGKFDLIFMDLQMPELNGLEATRAIRERENGAGKRICIVGLTAHAQRDVLDACLNAGMDKVLTKPVRMKGLQTAVNFCLSEP